MSDIENLLDIMAQLRDPQTGCPWDKKQSFESIAPYTIEEAYEVADAIERRSLEDLADELGDLLFQVVYHARMAEEAGAFGFADVVERICAKMLRRHPHVFGDELVGSAREQNESWDRLKQQERAAKSAADVLSDVPVTLPALTRALKLGRRAASVGFDWPDLAPVRAKLDEELAELDAEIESGNIDERAAEMGDVLFATANLCRHLDLDPERCLRQSNSRFERRFAHVQAAVDAGGGDWKSLDLESLDRLWKDAKLAEKRAMTQR